MAKKKYKTVTVSAYDPWITVKKFFTGLLITLVPIILAYIIDFVQGPEFPVEYAVYIPIIVGMIHALMNLLKHYNDTKTIEVEA